MTSQTKVLFWIDSVWSQFAFAKFMQDSCDGNFFAISDLIPQNTNYLETQNYVNFNKIWNIRKNKEKINDISIDLDYLSSIEKKFDLNIWSIVYADRYFYRFNPYHYFSRDEILKLVQSDCKLFEKIIDEINPKFLIMYSYMNFRQELLYRMCKNKGIKIMIINYPKINYKFMLSETTDKCDLEFNFDSSNQNISTKSFKELRNSLKKYPQSMKNYAEKKSLLKGKLKTFLHFFLISYNSEYKKLYRNFGRTRFKILINEFKIIYNSYLVDKFFKQKLSKKINSKEKFIYFPVHFEPERALTEPAPYYTNQIEVIVDIAKSLPAKYRLYVKEHPLQKSAGWKNIDFYKQIYNLPNVTLIHHLIPQSEILEKCALVITVSGSAGLEALFYEKPVITFGQTVYSEISSVSKVNDINNLPKMILNSLQQKVNVTELDAFVQFIDNNSFDFDWFAIEKYTEDNFFKGGFLPTDVSDDKFDLFFEHFKSTFELVAEEFIKKINVFLEIKNKEPYKK
jgi:hypothetical protein